MKIVCLIPSFNEEKTIGGLVCTLRKMGFDCLVIDDGSKDNSAKLAHDNGAEVLMNQVNLGKGASLRKGFDIIKQRDYEAVIVMDADGQHLPQDIPAFISVYEKNRPGVVVGNRMHEPKGMPLLRWLTNSFMSFILSRKCRQAIPDTQCGFRLMDMEVLRKISLDTDRFEIESEILLEAARLGFKIESVPIASVYEGQHSDINPWKDTLRFFKFLSHRN